MSAIFLNQLAVFMANVDSVDEEASLELGALEPLTAQHRGLTDHPAFASRRAQPEARLPSA
ncbi:MAG: hypothetical protein JWL70_955 [Acidimicrobiia bacterium]|nr:hypothetical protein [Acidimicrobiia bacterium]